MNRLGCASALDHQTRTMTASCCLRSLSARCSAVRSSRGRQSRSFDRRNEGFLSLDVELKLQYSRHNTFNAVCLMCGSEIEIPSVYIGKHVKCHDCGTDYIAEPQIAAASKPNGTPKSPAPVAQVVSASSPARRSGRGYSPSDPSKGGLFCKYCLGFGWLSLVARSGRSVHRGFSV